MPHPVATLAVVATALAASFAAPMAAQERRPVPSSTQLSRSRAKVRSAMADELQLERRTVSEKRRLVRTLLETAANTESVDDRYALYVEAAEAASAAGSVPLLDESLDQLSRTFQVERWDRLVDLASEVRASHPWVEAENAEALLLLADLALRANEPKSAVALAKLAVRPGQASGYETLDALCEQRKRSIEQIERGIGRARETLAETPEDPAANLALGTFALSFGVEEEAGLEALRLCGDEALRAAADLDAEQAEGREGLLALAGAWEIAARDRTPPEFRAALLARAAARVEQASALLSPGGLEHREDAGRVAELRDRARQLLRDPERKQRDDQTTMWKPKAKVTGCRAAGGESCGATLAGVIVTSDEQWLEVEITETWTVRQGKNKGQLATPKYLWRFERLSDDPRTGRVTFAVRDARLLGPGDPRHRRNYGGTVTIRGKTMSGDYRYDWTNEQKLETPPLEDWFLELE